jgi:hypothetical protein
VHVTPASSGCLLLLPHATSRLLLQKPGKLASFCATDSGRAHVPPPAQFRNGYVHVTAPVQYRDV